MIRNATAADVPVIHEMIRELAEYEKSLDEVRATPDQLHEALFGERPAAFAHIAENESGEPMGFSIWFLSFSTWRGVHGIYLEDLYVAPRPGAAATARRSSPNWPASAWPAVTSAWSGRS